MKKIVMLCFVLLSTTIFAEECIHKPKEGQACLNAKNLPPVTEISDVWGRKLLLEFSPSNMLQCRITLIGFRPNEQYKCSTVSFGEDLTFNGQVTASGNDKFYLDLSPEEKVRCACTKSTSLIEILPEREERPFKILINWDK